MRSPRTTGFTLIEVLVALAIVAIGMAAVMRTVTSSADTVSYLRDKTFAQWVALNQIATLRISGQQPQVGKSDGEIDYAGRTWLWHQEVVASEVPGVMRIDLSVRPKDVKVENAESGWYATVSGIKGDAIATPLGDLNWGSQLMSPGSASPLNPQQQGPGGAPGTSPPGVGQPGSGQSGGLTPLTPGTPTTPGGGQ